jgi:flagellar assembly protein FliH
MKSALIPSEDIAGYSRWRFDGVGAVAAEDVAPPPIDPRALADAHAQGLAEGRAAGRAEALAEARAQHEAYVAAQGSECAARLAALVAAAESGLHDAQQDIARGTLEIACALARQVLRHELVTQPRALEPVVHEALAMLMADGRSACVRLSPADFDLLDEPLRAAFATQAVSVLADAAVAPGDCRVESAGAVIDGGLSTRWARAVASLGLDMPWQLQLPDRDHGA